MGLSHDGLSPPVRNRVCPSLSDTGSQIFAGQADKLTPANTCSFLKIALTRERFAKILLRIRAIPSTVYHLLTDVRQEDQHSIRLIGCSGLIHRHSVVAFTHRLMQSALSAPGADAEGTTSFAYDALGTGASNRCIPAIGAELAFALLQSSAASRTFFAVAITHQVVAERALLAMAFIHILNTVWASRTLAIRDTLLAVFTLGTGTLGLPVTAILAVFFIRRTTGTTRGRTSRISRESPEARRTRRIRAGTTFPFLLRRRTIAGGRILSHIRTARRRLLRELRRNENLERRRRTFPKPATTG